MASKPRKTNVRKRKPISKNKRTLISVLLALALTALLTVLIVGIYLVSFMVSYVNGDPKINLEEYKENQDQTTIIYAYDSNNQAGELSRLYGEQNRVWVT